MSMRGRHEAEVAFGDFPWHGEVPEKSDGSIVDDVVHEMSGIEKSDEEWIVRGALSVTDSLPSSCADITHDSERLVHATLHVPFDASKAPRAVFSDEYGDDLGVDDYR